jgi:hypothetical protein
MAGVRARPGVTWGLVGPAAALITLWSATAFWTYCGSGINIGLVVIVVFPVLWLVNGAVFAAVLAGSRQVAGRAAALGAAAVAVTAVCVVIGSGLHTVVNPMTFPPIDIDGYAVSDEIVRECTYRALYAVLLPDPALSTGYGIDFVARGGGSRGAAPYTDLLALTDVA